MIIFKKIRTLFKNKTFRYIFTFICFGIGYFTTYFIQNKFNINLFGDKKISIIEIIVLLIFLYIITDIVKIIKSEKEKNS